MRRIIRGTVDGADIDFGALPNGTTLTGRVAMDEGDLDPLLTVDGEEMDNDWAP